MKFAKDYFSNLDFSKFIQPEDINLEYEDGKYPYDLLLSISERLNKQDEIINNQQIIISKLTDMIENSEKSSKSAKINSIIANVISVISLTVAILSVLLSLL